MANAVTRRCAARPALAAVGFPVEQASIRAQVCSGLASRSPRGA
jgi:hypothetical protein